MSGSLSKDWRIIFFTTYRHVDSIRALSGLYGQKKFSAKESLSSYLRTKRKKDPEIIWKAMDEVIANVCKVGKSLERQFDTLT